MPSIKNKHDAELATNVLEIANSDDFFTFANMGEFMLVDFFGTWCPPCTTQGEILHNESPRLLEQFKELKLYKINVDHDKGLSDSFGIQAIPCIVLVYKKAIVKLTTGLHSMDDIISEVTKFKENIDTEKMVIKSNELTFFWPPGESPNAEKEKKKPKKKKD